MISLKPNQIFMSIFIEHTKQRKMHKIAILKYLEYQLSKY